MGDKTGIEWTNATWNPLLGCRRVSPGCGDGTGGGCYAERMAARLCGPGKRYEGMVRSTPTGPRWTGASRLVVEALDQPLRWKKPRMIFVDSMADLFFEGHSNEDIAAVFGVMAACPQHTFQVLTKRPERAREWFAWVAVQRGQTARSVISQEASQRIGRAWDFALGDLVWPLPNVWLGVSAENQETADERIPILLEIPAAVRFVSYEPALGPVDFTRWMRRHSVTDVGDCAAWCEACRLNRDAGRPLDARLDWIIAGSESGPRARPAELEWFRSVRDQCAAAGVPFFFKQWVGGYDLTLDLGGMSATEAHPRPPNRPRGKISLPVLDGRQHAEFPR